MENKLPTAGIFIPTMNRVDFVIRQLRYYASVQCPHTIYIGDSSPKEDSEKINSEIKKLGNKIKAKYYYIPGYNSWQAHNYLVSKIEEKYTCYSGDDDYQIPRSITKCIEFLENNPEYTSASGGAVSFRLQNGSLHGELKRLADYPRQQIENNIASERIIRFFNNYYVTHFSVNRSEVMKKCWQSAENITDPMFGAEILPTSLPLIYGKSKILDCLGFVRQIHDQRSSVPSIFDWITNLEWPSSYSLFEKITSKELATKDNISIEDATKVIRKSFWDYLQKYLSKHYEIYHSTKAKVIVSKQVIDYTKSKITRIFPILKKIYRMQIKPQITGKKELNFEVLQSDSPYYKDFKPVMESFMAKQR
ncbi:MAG: TIGR00180 family glycosyltransferase [bacterium]|nr:TIGR00180 family glycosyltransferase [bacterium]